MKNISLLIFLNVVFMAFLSCEGMATLFHGPEPEEPKPAFTITYTANGATTGTAPASQTVTIGSIVTLSGEDSLTFSGKTFIGWSVSPSGAGITYIPGYLYMVNGNQTFYARWVNAGDVQQYTVTFDINGASGTAPEPQTVSTGIGTSISINIPNQRNLVNTDKIFAGWNEAANGSGANYNAGDPLPVSGNLTLYAQWIDPAVQRYTVTYLANGASGSPPSPRTVNRGTGVMLPGQGSLILSGKMFNGWNTAENGTGLSYNARDTLTVSGNLTLYAQWIVQRYTVTYHANGASGSPPAAQTVNAGTSITLPGQSGLTYSDKTFNGWNEAAEGIGANHSAGSPYTPTDNVTLYARWMTVLAVSSDTGFTGALTTIRSNGTDDRFIIAVESDISLAPQDLTLVAYKDKTITLKGDSAARKITLSGTGSLFTVGADVSLELENITLAGRNDNNAPLVKVNNSGTLALKTGGKITGNTYTITTTQTGGGGVFVAGGTLEISGGEVSGNGVNYNGSAPMNLHGGGILAESGSTVTMTAGSIRGNSLTSIFPGEGGGRGGGISVWDSSFEMSGGIIEGNSIDIRATGSGASAGLGGGVIVTRTRFFLKGNGIIRNNFIVTQGNSNSASRGGGIEIEQSEFVMEGGVIYGNRVQSSVNPNIIISGVYPHGAYGSGVCVGNASGEASATIRKTGGIIYGNDITGTDGNSIPYKNTAQSDSTGLGGGHAVYYFIGGTTTRYWLNGTAGENHNLDNSVAGSGGGWE